MCPRPSPHCLREGNSYSNSLTYFKLIKQLNEIIYKKCYMSCCSMFNTFSGLWPKLPDMKQPQVRRFPLDRDFYNPWRWEGKLMVALCVQSRSKRMMKAAASASAFCSFRSIYDPSCGVGWDHWHSEWVDPPHLSLSGNTLINTPKGVCPRWFKIQPRWKRMMNITYSECLGSEGWILQLSQISCFSSKYLVFFQLLLSLLNDLHVALLLFVGRLFFPIHQFPNNYMES